MPASPSASAAWASSASAASQSPVIISAWARFPTANARRSQAPSRRRWAATAPAASAPAAGSVPVTTSDRLSSAVPSWTVSPACPASRAASRRLAAACGTRPAWPWQIPWVVNRPSTVASSTARSWPRARTSADSASAAGVDAHLQPRQFAQGPYGVNVRVVPQHRHGGGQLLARLGVPAPQAQRPPGRGRPPGSRRPAGTHPRPARPARPPRPNRRW
jgi:hypothetical protein